MIWYLGMLRSCNWTPHSERKPQKLETRRSDSRNTSNHWVMTCMTVRESYDTYTRIYMLIYVLGTRKAFRIGSRGCACILSRLQDKSPSAITDHPAIPTGITMLPPSDRMLDATSATNQFTVDAPTMWVGWKRRGRDLHSILVVCTCGHAVSENEIEKNEDVIKCKWAGCETGWVSESCKYQLE